MDNSTVLTRGSDRGFKSFFKPKGQFLKSLALGVAGVFVASMSFGQLAAGTYTINSNVSTGGSNFANFNDLATAVTLGITGQVTVNVVVGSGPYIEQVTFPAIPGVGPGPGGNIGITINGNGETIQFGTATGNYAVINMNGMDYMTIDSLVVKQTSSSQAFAVRLGNSSDENIFRNCTFENPNSTTYNNVVFLTSASATSYSFRGSNLFKNLTLENNTFKGGYYNTRINGATSSSATATWSEGLVMNNNTFTDYHYAGAYVYYYMQGVECSGNTFNARGTYNWGYNMYFYRLTDLEVTKNMVNNGNRYGIYTYYINRYGTPSGRSLIANNMLNGDMHNGNTLAYGIMLYYSDDMDVLFNSVHLRNQNNTISTSYGTYYYSCSDMTSNNNVIQVTGNTRYGYYSRFMNGTYDHDYDTYWAESNSMTFYHNGTTINGFAALQTAGHHGNSQETSPSFVSNSDNHINGANLYQKAKAFAAVTDDIDGTSRPTSPSMGAHEFTPPQNDAGVGMFTQPVAVCPDTNEVIVTVRNYGALPLGSFTVNYSWTGLSTGSGTVPVVATPPIAPGADTSIKLSDIVMVAGAPGYDFVAYTTVPNGVTDEQPLNDTARYSTQTAMNGTYTIGSSAGKDFGTFTDAVNALGSYDVCGAVIFHVESGIYPEKLDMPMLLGSDSVNTVTFMGDPANTSPAHLEFNSTSFSDNFVVRLTNGVGHFIFDDLEIESKSTSYGRIFDISSSAHDVMIKNCRLMGQTSTTTSNYMALIYGFGPNVNNIEVTGNTFENGAYGYYMSLDWQNNGMNHMVSDNEFEDPYYSGVYMYSVQGAEINSNKINTSSAYLYYNYPIYFSNNSTNHLEVMNNEIYWDAVSYGIYLFAGGTTSEHPMILNNKVSTGDYTSNRTSYGIYLSGGYGQIVHNSVVLVGSGTNGRAMYINGGLNTVMNNIVYADSAGYGMYFGSGYAVLNSDHNSIYASDGSIGYFNGTTAATIGDWQTNTGFDMNSISVANVFASFDSLYSCADSLVGAGQWVEYVPTDIDGDERNVNGPTIGAEEYFTAGGFDLGDDQDLCDGDTLVLGRDVSGSISWSTGDTSTTIVVTTPDTYHVTVNGECGVSKDTVVVEDAAPTANFVPTTSFLTGVFTNTSNKGTSYMWDFGDGMGTSTDEHPSYVYQATGTYNVCLTTTNDCDMEQTCQSIHVSDYVGINEVALKDAVSIYPNPASDVLNVKFENVSSEYMAIEISNLQGQVIYSNVLNEFTGNAIEPVNVSNLSNGVYFVKVSSDNEIVTKRVVVQ